MLVNKMGKLANKKEDGEVGELDGEVGEYDGEVGE